MTWDDLILELKVMQDWYAEPTFHPLMSAYVGVRADGDYYGGVNVDAEWMQEEDLAATGGTFETCIADLIHRMLEYRAKCDAEAAEDEADYVEGHA